MAVKNLDLTLPGISAGIKELKAYIQSAGKRAQARHKTLEKAYRQGGSMEGKKSPLLEKYPKMDTKVKGLSRNALAKKAAEISKFLTSKSSTVAGVKAIEKERAATMERKAKERAEAKGEKYRKRSKKKSEQYWSEVGKIMGKLQQAGKQGDYDSNETLDLAEEAVKDGQTADTVLDWLEEQGASDVEDWYLSQSWEDLAGTYGAEDLEDEDYY